jgi:TonB family protein
MRPVPRAISRYQILERLGGGGMGVLYLARDPHIDRLVALKLLHSHFDEDVRERFAQEARAAGALAHPNIVTIHDFGQYDDAPFIVMEYVRGETVAEVIKQRAAVPLLKKLRWMEELCAGLSYAHRSKVIHRDIKPLNLMIDQHGTLKILDFGIARMVDSGLTQVSMQIGTPGYMSPEQIEGAPVDQRADIFATGAVFYELLAYRAAFSGDSSHVIMNRALKENPAPLHELCDGLDPAIEEIVVRALQKDPRARFQDIAQMRTAIERVRGSLEAGYVEPTLIAAAPMPTPRPVRRTDRSALERRRSTELAGHVEAARRAFASRDYDAAAEACERALVIDPSHAEALALLDEIQGSDGKTEVRTLLHKTRAALRDGSLTDAQELLRQASNGSVDGAVLDTLREELELRHAERRGEERPLTGARLALARAQSCAELGATEAALRYIDDALALDPTNADAIALRDRLADAPLTPTYVATAQRVTAGDANAPHARVNTNIRRLLVLGTVVIAIAATGAIGYGLLVADRSPAATAASVGNGADSEPGRAEPPPPEKAPEPPEVKPVRVGGSIPEPRKIHHVEPIHPPEARNRRVYGTVRLEITIGTDGKVREASVVNSIPLLDKAAHAAATQWRYEPTVVDGQLVPVILNVGVPFAYAGGIAENTAVRKPPPPDALRSAQQAEQQQDYDTALREYQNAMGRDPENEAAREGLARVGERKNRADRFVRQAAARFADGDYEGAVSSANRAIETYPRHAGALELLKKIQTAREAEQVRRKKPGQQH